MRSIICLFAVLLIFSITCKAQDFTIPEMKKIALLPFSQAESIILKKNYNFERTDRIPNYQGADHTVTKFASKDERRRIMISEVKTTKKDNTGKPIISYTYKVYFSFNDPLIFEKYKSFLNANKYKEVRSITTQQEFTTEYKNDLETKGLRKYTVNLTRRQMVNDGRYGIQLIVEP